MRILVMSDSHDNIVRLRHVLGFAKVEKFDAVIHCGDWDSPLAVSEISKSRIKLYGVLGNADIDNRMVQQLFEVCEEFDENFLDLRLDNKKIGIHHFPTGLNDAILSQEYDLLFCGHSHKRKDEKYRKTRIVNVGALHRTDSPCFVVYDTQKDKVEFVEVVI
jgi:uncharacterized protein